LNQTKKGERSGTEVKEVRDETQLRLQLVKKTGFAKTDKGVDFEHVKAESLEKGGPGAYIIRKRLNDI